MSIGSTAVLSGDAIVSVLSHAQLLDIDHLIRCPAGAVPDLIDLYNSEKDAGWTGRDLKEEVRTLEGRAVYIAPDLGDALFAADLGSESELYGEATRKLQALHPGLKFLTADVLFYRTGFVSVNLTLCAANGWDDNSVVDVFAYEKAEKAFLVLADTLTLLLRDAVKPLYALIKSRKIEFERLLKGGAPRLEEPASIECRSMHLIYGGNLRRVPDRERLDAAAIDDAYLPLIYAERPGPVQNQSPVPNEFVYLGYAFSFFGTSRDARQRCFELTLLVRLQHALFERLNRFASYWQELGKTVDRSDLVSVQAVSYELRKEYLDFCSTTFVRRHEFLVLRKHLIRVWDVDQLFEKARSTLAFIEEFSERAESRRRRSYERSLQVILVAIALLSVVSVIADARQILAAFWE